MNVEFLQLIEPPKKTEEESKPVRPTLVIGLGGTGKEILLRFRRLLVERYGSLDPLPFVRFLHLDTDSTSNAKEQYDLKADDDPLFPKVRFSPAERVDLTVEGGTGKYVENINTYPHIKRWFQTDGKIAKLGNLGEGAGQVRSASRLGFYHAPNFSNLSSHLDRAQSALKDAANLDRARELGFELDPETINVFVAASLAGGTGAGVFIDMGFLLQKYFPNADRVALLMLPNFFRDYAGGGRARANGYAALTELNHYAFGSGFEANWDGANAERIPPPPYTTTYLIDSTNEADLMIGSSGKEYDTYRMCAEFLFHDFSISSFAGLKRAIRINLVNFNMNVYTHNFLNEALSGTSGTARNVVGDTFPTRFGSFGLSTLSFPTDRVHNACASRLARTILESWEREQVEDPLERLFTDFLSRPEIRFVQGRYERRDGAGVIEGTHVEDALLWYDQAGGRTFPGQIWDRVQTLRGEVEAAPRGEKEVVLARGLEQLEQQLTREDSADRDEWGVWVRTIDENMRRYLEDLQRGIRSRTEEIANDRRRGVVQALTLLRELKAIVRNDTYQYLPHFSEAVPQWEEQIRHYSHEVQRLQSDITRHDRQRLFRTADLRRDLDLLAPTDQKAEDLGALYTYLYARVMKQVVKRALRICKEVDELLGKDDPTGKGLIAQYYHLLQNFQDLKARLQRKERYFTKPERSELTISLYQDGDVNSWYRTWVGPSNQEAEVVQLVGNQILAEVFRVASVTEALHFLETTPPDQAEDRMLGHCKRFFASRGDQPEALQLLLDTNRFSSAEQEEKIALAYRLAKVWAKKAERGLDHINLRPVLADQRPCLIGLDQNDTRRSKQFEQLVRKSIQRAGDSPPSFKGIGDANRGMIVFYNELAGIPAFYPSSVMAPQGLREAYESYQEKDELHVDKNRFQFGDLIPKRVDEANRYAESLKAFVLGRLLGVLRVKELPNPGSEEPILSYSYKRSSRLAVEEVNLGEESRAIDRLYRDVREPHETDRRKLLDEIETAIHRLRVQRHLEVYALLLDFYMDFVYPKAEEHLRTREERPQDVTLVKYPPNYAVLALARDQLSRMLPDEKEAAQLRVALETLRDKSLDEELSYEEYAEALAPRTKPAGRVLVRQEGAVSSQRPSYRLVLALDLAKIEPGKAQHTSGAPIVPMVAGPPAPAEIPERPCPTCGALIDSRAIYCRSCKKYVAEHVTCPHCGEEKVPSDLEACWHCGKTMPRSAEAMDCPQCYAFRGKPDEFPCPVCGYSLTGEPAAPEPRLVSAESPGGSGGPAEAPVAAAGTSAAGGKSESGGARPSKGTVQCPTCYEEVEPGLKCSVCGGLLI